MNNSEKRYLKCRNFRAQKLSRTETFARINFREFENFAKVYEREISNVRPFAKVNVREKSRKEPFAKVYE